MATYEVLINVQDDEGRPAKYMRWDTPKYQAGDALVRTWGPAEFDSPPGIDPMDIAWSLVTKHNRDDRPDGRCGPSFSEGDVFVIDGRAFASVGDCTLAEVPVPESYITDRTWLEVTA